MNEYEEVLRKYAVFEGRARRKEYWFFYLFNLIINVALISVGKLLDTNLLPSVYSVIILIPSLAVAVRRLHDSGKSGWWLLIGLIPIIGWIIILIFLCRDSQPRDNMYGANPKMAIEVIPASSE